MVRPASQPLCCLCFGSPACTPRASSGPAAIALPQASSQLSRTRRASSLALPQASSPQPQGLKAHSASSLARPQARSPQPQGSSARSASCLPQKGLLLPDAVSFLHSSSRLESQNTATRRCLETHRPRSVPCSPSPREGSSEERRRRCRSENDEVLKKLNLTVMHSLHATGDQAPGRDASSENTVRRSSVLVGPLCPESSFFTASFTEIRKALISVCRQTRNIQCQPVF